MEITSNQHPDSIWTWRSNRRGSKVSLWLPYFQMVTRLPKGKSDRYCFKFNGGEVTCHLRDIDFLMLYGASGELPIEFLDRLSSYNIPLMIHRRNMQRPYIFFPQYKTDDKDVLSRQIEFRNNDIKRAYIARTLIRARVHGFEDKIPVSRSDLKKLNAARSIKTIKAIEARLTRRFWAYFYSQLGIPEVVRRNNKHPVNVAMDAMSYFLYGLILRWALFHKLSPCHGYLHIPTSYPSLCYDLLEPYRYLIEDTAFAAVNARNDDSQFESLVGRSLNILKERLHDDVYVPSSRSITARKNLLHGAVLALRAYLTGDSKRFVVPAEGIKTGGRPMKLGFTLPGCK